MACLAHLAADFSIHFRLPAKPFQCDMCLGWWLSLFPFIVLHGWTGIPMAAITAVLADVIYRLKEKL